MTMTTRTIDTYCAERAAELRAKGWEDGGAEYDIGAYFGDREGWEDEIGRTLETGEVLALERGIRRALDIALDTFVSGSYH